MDIIKQAILKRFPNDAYAVFWEVGNGTGMNCTRHADCVVMSLWPSRGLEVIGIEIKRSRSDWLNDRDNPEKSESILKYCDRWYLVISDEKFVHLGELPESWGMMTIKSNSLRIVKEAPKLTPVSVDRDFLMSLARKIHQKYQDREAIKKSYNEGLERGKQIGGSSYRYDSDRLKRLEKAIEEFEEKSGLKIIEYNSGNVGAAVRTVLKYGIDSISRDLESHRDKIKRLLDEMNSTLDEIHKMDKELVPWDD